MDPFALIFSHKQDYERGLDMITLNSNTLYRFSGNSWYFKNIKKRTNKQDNFTKEATGGVLLKNVSQKNTCVGVSFLIKLQTSDFVHRTPPVATSEYAKYVLLFNFDP